MANFNKKSLEQFFYALLSLPQKEVKIFNILQWVNNSVTVSIKWILKKHQCPNCWSYNTKQVWNKYEITKSVKHLFISNYTTVELDIYKKRLICYNCTKNNNWKRKYFMEVFSFLDKCCHYTNVFKCFILREWKF